MLVPAPALERQRQQARQKRQFTKAPTVHEHKPGQAFATTDSGGGRKKQNRHQDVLTCNVTVAVDELIRSLQRVEEWTA